MTEEVKDGQFGAEALEGLEAPDQTRSIFKSAQALPQALPKSLPQSLPESLHQPIQGDVTPVFITGPHKFFPKQEISPATRMERDIPWKLVFVLYAFFAVGGLVLFGVFLVTMIRIYKQQVY